MKRLSQLLLFLCTLLTSCSRLQMEDRCTYVREVKTTYHCDAGKLDRTILAPTAPD